MLGLEQHTDLEALNALLALAFPLVTLAGTGLGLLLTVLGRRTVESNAS